MNPELTQKQMQLSKDLQGALQMAMSTMQNGVDTAAFTTTDSLSQCCIQLATCCQLLAQSCIEICGAIASEHPAPGALTKSTTVATSLAPAALTLGTTTQTWSVAFTGALPTIGTIIQQIPGKVDNIITGALKQMQTQMAKLQFPESPTELSSPIQEVTTPLSSVTSSSINNTKNLANSALNNVNKATMSTQDLMKQVLGNLNKSTITTSTSKT